jgi:hypothetical protein
MIVSPRRIRCHIVISADILVASGIPVPVADGQRIYPGTRIYALGNLIRAKMTNTLDSIAREIYGKPFEELCGIRKGIVRGMLQERQR